ncbi:hypothetical protein B0H17DRAFT_1113843, partial [Mycena rosella]
ARRFDREIAEEAKRAPAPVFVDDDSPDYHSDPYADHSEHCSGPTAYSDPAAHTAYSDPAHTDGEYLASDAVHSGGTPSNYMYPSGYSDLGFSDVSSHGTYAQPPMKGQYNPGSYAAYGAVGAAGAYEMTGYRNAHQPRGASWASGIRGSSSRSGARRRGRGGYVYGRAQRVPASDDDNSSGSDVLGQNKSGGGAWSLYADGYVSQYQTHAEDTYGGLDHGHVVHDEENEDEGDGRRYLRLQVANE